MDRGIPTFNRVVVQKIQQKNMQAHYQNLFNIHHAKGWRTEASPSSIAKTNSKKEQLTEERNTEIDKKNVILFQKMNRIMNRADPLNPGTTQLKINSRRFANHVQKINEENQQFLQRLCNSKPTINNKKMQEQGKKQRLLLKSMGRNSQHTRMDKADSVHLSKRSQMPSYRYNVGSKQLKQRKEMQESVSLGKISSSFMFPLNPRPRYTEGDQFRSNQFEQAQNYFKKEMVKLQQRRKKIQSSISQYQQKQVEHSLGKQKQRSQRILKKESVFENKSIVLFATFKKMNELIYKVEIHRRHRAYEILCVEVDSLHQKLVASLEEAVGNQLFSSIDYNYQTIVDGLQIVSGKLVINHQKIRRKSQQDIRRKSQQDHDEPMPSQMKMRIKPHQNINPSHITQQSLQHQQSHVQIPEGNASRQNLLRSLYNK